jgi:hypothetical protein
MWFTHWLDTSEGSKFAEQIATDYDKLRRSVVVRGDDSDKRARKFEKLAKRVEEFHREHRLNFYQKAKMLSDIKAGMSLYGIEQEEISAFLRALLLKGLPR